MLVQDAPTRLAPAVKDQCDVVLLALGHNEVHDVRHGILIRYNMVLEGRPRRAGLGNVWGKQVGAEHKRPHITFAPRVLVAQTHVVPRRLQLRVGEIWRGAFQRNKADLLPPHLRHGLLQLLERSLTLRVKLRHGQHEIRASGCLSGRRQGHRCV